MSWLSTLSKTAQNLIAIGTIVVITAGATAATVRFIGVPQEIKNVDKKLDAMISQHAEDIDTLRAEDIAQLKMHQDAHEQTILQRLDHIQHSIESLDLRLCLEQADRDGTDPRLCAEN